MSDAVPTPTNAAAYAVVHTGAGLAVGLAIHALIPSPVDDEGLAETGSYVALQALMNRMAVYVSTRVLDGQNDPTAGVLFLWALMASQPEFTDRLKTLTAAAASGIASPAVERFWPSKSAAA